VGLSLVVAGLGGSRSEKRAVGLSWWWLVVSGGGWLLRKEKKKFGELGFLENFSAGGSGMF
jgi:hypothetical protein